MLARILRFFALPLLLVALPGHAAFHLWVMSELYSNADGSVQFLELSAITGGQQFLIDHQLRSTPVGGATQVFTFPGNLPGDTSGRTMLIATQGFAALGIVAPDYVVPNGFFGRNGGSINFGESADVWNHGAVPQDTRSLNRDGSTATNSPRNFAGVSGTVSAASALNFQGLWYRGEVESGWGVNIAHQGDIFFVTWFTYDTDGSQMWLVAPDVRKGSGNSYGGQLFRTTGPAFSSVPFNPAMIGITNVGSVGFSFTDSNNGTFTYTVNGVTTSKPIVRQVFGALPDCTQGGSTGTPGVLNYQDLWYAAPAESEAGWGVNVTHQGDILFVTWFTYDSTGRGMWIVGPRLERTAANTYSGGLFRTTGPAYNAVPWNPSNVTPTQVGTATFTFSSANSGTFNYTVNGIQQTKNITKQVFGSPATVCR